MATVLEMDFKEFDAHFSTKVSPEIVSFATNEVFLWSRYIFTERRGRKQYGYCTHCRNEFETAGMREGTEGTCLVCESQCHVKASGRKRTKLIDEAYFVYYEKSVANPNAITARGFYAIRDYREDYHNVETQFQVKVMYLFEPGRSMMFERLWLWYSQLDGWHTQPKWHQRKTVGTLTTSTMMYKPCYYSVESINKAVKNTPFQYSMWEKYRDRDMVEFFDLAAQYPCVEYLTKLGFRSVVEAKLYGYRTYGVVNWRAKNPLKVLRVTKQEMNALREMRNVTPWMLYLYSVSKRDGSNFALEELPALADAFTEDRYSELKESLRHATLRELLRYLDSQLRKPAVTKHYHSYSQLLTTWRDYIRDCVTLELNLSAHSLKFPKNLYNAHQNMMTQVKVQADEILNQKVMQRAKKLSKFEFETQGLCIRPAGSVQELIDEGEALNHCVGRYAGEYGKGSTDLFVIRRVSEPDKPFYTMEIRNGYITQCRGRGNEPMTPEVKSFVELFTEKKLLTKKRTRVGVAI